ncbi:hypothetical protein I3843_09G145200 [Carya illinoinensis]|uniref:Uncharacterized protein n=1 Tax=Carya illinoinensis TaxID=32201 RepID=A0A922E4F9_CARIL|nr:hypothetical protein I3842_09G149700 [Carya illinoinensis]KAG7963976.1 hypothetical protein I3843_09G145200 [Carya illinoinensis]
MKFFVTNFLGVLILECFISDMKVTKVLILFHPLLVAERNHVLKPCAGCAALQPNHIWLLSLPFG